MNIHKKKQRIEFIKQFCNVDQSSIVEIGALDYPTFSPDEQQIKFIDYTTRELLSRNATNNPRYGLDRLVDVDYVCPDSEYSKVIDEKFDLIVANHVVEHISNAILWFHELEKLLRPGGILFLAVPDKRYTFDIARTETSFIELIRNNRANLNKPSFYQILDQIYYHKRVKAAEVWSGQDISDKLSRMRFSPTEAYTEAKERAAEPYHDIHCNVFTCDSFRETFQTLIELEEIRLEMIQVTDTYEGGNEFYAVFKKN